ncbi:hypothetical protein L1065_06875 [Nereida sp. MMG024]|nr:hypothetical protein [Nereida sp. MMG025]
MKLYAPFLCLALATGCATLPDAPAPAPTLPLQDTCNAQRLAPFVGQPLKTTQTTLMLQPVRVIRPNQPVTADLLPSRLNIIVTESDVIARLSCG